MLTPLWFRVIAIRRTIDSLRKRRKQVSLDDDANERHSELIDGEADPLDQLIDKEQSARRAQLSELTEQLSSTDRLLLEMIYIRKLGADEIAATLRIKKGAVYTRKTRLIQRLRSHAETAGLVE